MSQGSARFERNSACPACGGTRWRLWKKGTVDPSTVVPDSFKITDSHYGLTWDLSRCAECGHVFADPVPAPGFIASLYGALEDPLYDEEAEGRAKNFAVLLDRLEKLRPEKGRLFDVGAATGIFMGLARDRGWEVDGVEPGAWAVAKAREAHGLRIRTGTLEEIPLEPESCDVVTMIDLIEHTARPFEALRRAREILRPGGILSLVTPNVRSAAARIAGRRWWHYRPAHLGYFTRSSLDALLERTGFAVIRRESYAWHFSAHYLASRKSGLGFLVRNPRLASFLKRIPIKLALGDSFEIYARKEVPR